MLTKIILLYTRTTKYGEHFGTYDMTTEGKTYHLGLVTFSQVLLLIPSLKLLKIWILFVEKWALVKFQKRFCAR